MTYTLYILRCSDGTFYTGSTNDLEKRIHQHNTGRAGAKYTRGRRPVILWYSEVCPTYADVRRKEYEIKKLTKQQKYMLGKK